MFSFRILKAVALLLLVSPSISPAADYFWVGGSGAWQDTSHWAMVSGGIVHHATMPGPSDDVFFDQNSGFTGSEQVEMSGNLSCKTMDWRGITDSVTFFLQGEHEIHGSLYFSPLMKTIWANPISGPNSVKLNFVSTTFNNVIDPAGIPFCSSSFINLNFPNGSMGFRLEGAIEKCAGTRLGINLECRKFNTQGNAITTSNFRVKMPPYFGFNRGLLLGNSSIYSDHFYIQDYDPDSSDLSGARWTAQRFDIFTSDSLGTLIIQNPQALLTDTFGIFATRKLMVDSLSFDGPGRYFCEGNITINSFFNIYPGGVRMESFDTLVFRKEVSLSGTATASNQWKTAGGAAHFISLSDPVCFEYLDMNFVSVFPENNHWILGMGSSYYPTGRGWGLYPLLPCNKFIGIDDSQLPPEPWAIAPNPVKDLLRISGPNDRKTTFAILDLLGKLVLTGKWMGEDIEVGRLKTGLYFLRMVDGERMQALKFVKL